MASDFVWKSTNNHKYVNTEDDNIIVAWKLGIFFQVQM